jgi:hypothetical protein
VIRRSSIVVALVAVIWSLAAPSGWTVSNPYPKPPRRLTVQGKLTGKLRQGGKVVFQVVATDPTGWTDLSALKIVLVLHDQPIQDITFQVGEAIGEGTLSVTGHPPAPYPGSVPQGGSFLEVFQETGKKRSEELVRQTFGITISVSARVREAIPTGTIVRVIALSDDGDLVYARVRARVSGGFLSWGTFALAAAVALFLGAFIGNTVTHRRYRQREPSIWDIVERRLKEQRARPPAPALVGRDGGAS